MSAMSEHTSIPQPRARSMRGFWQVADLVAVAALLIILPGLILLPLPWLRIPVGLFAVLIAPGYSLTAALFAQRGVLDGVARAALSIGLSIALIPLLALLLDRLPWGLRPMPMAVSLCLLACTCCLVAGVRRHLSADPFTPLPAPSSGPPLKRLPLSQLAAIGAVLLVVLWGVAVYTAILTTPTRLTELYVLGAGGLAEGYPRQARVGEELAVTLGVVNQEGGAAQYRVELWAADPREAGRRQLLTTVEPFDLQPGATHEQRLSWAMPWPGEDQQVEILLFRDAGGAPWRRLRLWLNVDS